MFDRRVKIFLTILVLLTLVVLARSMQLQLVQHAQWVDQAKKINLRPELVETTRGRILDFRDKPIADNIPCIDACVDYRAITEPPDEKWVIEQARDRVRSDPNRTYAAADKKTRANMVADESKQVLADIQTMWKTLATLGNMSPEDMDDLRRSIERKVYLQRRHLWYADYENDLKKFESQPPTPWYQEWFLEDMQQAPDLDQYGIVVAEQTQPHVVLPHISNDIYIFLGKNQDKLPGLVLRPSIRRDYPYHNVAAHLIGHLSHVGPNDVGAKDKYHGQDLLEYKPNDLIGRAGLESLLEPLLRGTRGRNLTENGKVVDRTLPISGQDVRTTIDIKLQGEIQDAFNRATLTLPNKITDTLPMPGAAVVIDVPTGEVRALVSYPSYDLDTFDDDYASLASDYYNRPLMNRATQFALEPGSTVKPMVGLTAITEGIFPPDGTIECTGYLVLNGKKYAMGRCWTMSMYGFGHHQNPNGGSGSHATGFLTYPDALERSCNVFFETLADRIGMETLDTWFSKFGLGRPTGIGIREASGSLPIRSHISPALQRSTTWFAGIGQAQVRATPIQMANVAATIARDGIWMRPRLVPTGVTIPGWEPDGPDRVDLHLSPEGLAKAKQGMVAVVNGDAPTGSQIRRDDMTIAGKTGTAQASKLSIPLLDDDGRVKYKKISEDVAGTIVFVDSNLPQLRAIEPGKHDNPNPNAPWYHGSGEKEDTLTHAWFIGFAPAEHPQIAFAVFVEYGFAGGGTAGSVARQLLDACVAHGYLHK